MHAYMNGCIYIYICMYVYRLSYMYIRKYSIQLHRRRKLSIFQPKIRKTIQQTSVEVYTAKAAKRRK